MTDVLFLLGGLAMLTLGGELLVRGSVAFAQAIGISPLLIGLTFVGFGTSVPELVTSVQAARAGSPGIAVGNFVGSNISNTLLVLGLASLITPIKMHSTALRRDGMFVIAITTGFIVVSILYSLDRIVGISALCLLGTYLIYAYRQEAAAWAAWKEGHTAVYEKAEAYDELRDGIEDHRTPIRRLADRLGILVPVGIAVAGLIVVIIGGTLLVEGAVGIARALDVSEGVIGLTVVAIGTSSPEIVTTLVAALRRHADMALGNVLGSNIYNLLAIGGATALISPTSVPEQIVWYDNFVMLGSALLLLALARTGYRIVRLEGLVLFTCYGLYLWSLWPGT